jgi:hypothetical protein
VRRVIYLSLLEEKQAVENYNGEVGHVVLSAYFVAKRKKNRKKERKLYMLLCIFSASYVKMKGFAK